MYNEVVKNQFEDLKESKTEKINEGLA